MFLFSITLVVFSLGVFMMTVAEFVLVGQTSEEKKSTSKSWDRVGSAGSPCRSPL